MKTSASHLSDEQLLLAAEGELSKRDAKLVEAHLEACWQCRARRQELAQAVTDFVHLNQQEFDVLLPPGAGPRALLKARLAEVAGAQPAQHQSWFLFSGSLAAAAAICAIVALAFALSRFSTVSHNPSRMHGVVYIPDSRLTPGATLLESRLAVCTSTNINNKAVPASLQREVFEEYGIAGADPHAYEVDYLVTPALGGAEDIHNLWPHSNSATVWNAQVKDALEDRLRDMVCGGSLDLTEAQREIAGNWIAAYKKYFHTDKPLAEHCNRCAR